MPNKSRFSLAIIMVAVALAFTRAFFPIPFVECESTRSLFWLNSTRNIYIFFGGASWFRGVRAISSHSFVYKFTVVRREFRNKQKRCEFTGIVHKQKQNLPSFYLSCSLLRLSTFALDAHQVCSSSIDEGAKYYQGGEKKIEDMKIWFCWKEHYHECAHKIVESFCVNRTENAFYRFSASESLTFTGLLVFW